MSLLVLTLLFNFFNQKQVKTRLKERCICIAAGYDLLPGPDLISSYAGITTIPNDQKKTTHADESRVGTKTQHHKTYTQQK